MVAPWGVQAERDRGDEGDHAIFAGWSRADWEFDASLLQATPRTDPAQPGAGEVETPPEVSLPNLPSPPAPKAPRRGPHANVATCQVDGCSATEASGPFRWKRCRICDLHASCSSFYHRGRLSRFCQLCKVLSLHPSRCSFFSSFSCTSEHCARSPPPRLLSPLSASTAPTSPVPPSSLSTTAAVANATATRTHRAVIRRRCPPLGSNKSGKSKKSSNSMAMSTLRQMRPTVSQSF